jgi:hypothetical protein
VRFIEECEISLVALCPLRVFDTLPKDSFVISPFLKEAISRIKAEGIEVSVLSGIGEQGW